ncbi:MAG: ral secretion pathway protein [Alphaproteobacteria bacterium]|jgi:general secretion pathway protein J|nr:ral secretion pathway protein [Alphaproteobacteria bacterium]
MKRCRFRNRSNARGFTLIETLIATALMGAVLAALATVTAQWLPNWNRGFERVQRAELLDLGLERLVDDLSAAEFIPPNRASPNPLFDGSQLAVTFVRSAIGPNTRPGLEVVRIAETADERGPVMVRTRAPFMPITPGAGAGNELKFSDPVVLVRTPYRISFAYAGRDRIWQDTWHDATLLPSSVRVTLRDAASQRTLSVSTAALIHVQLPVECIRANVTTDCGRLPPGVPITPGAPPNPGANSSPAR